MTSTDWNELHLSEDPAVELLQGLGYAFVPSEKLEEERGSLRAVILFPRLASALKKLNPWLSEDNIKKAIRSISHVQAANLLEANEKIHTILTHGISLEQDIGDGQGKKGHTVHFIDYENTGNNELTVTRQFKVSRLGAIQQNIIVDVMVFVNGIPLVVIECKSPTIHEPIEKGVEQLTRYQELEDKFTGLGAPNLFETAQILVSTCGQAAKYATVATSNRFWAEWKVPYPISLDELQKRLGRVPTPQDVLLFGLLEPTNLLDLVRNFIVFETEAGKTVKKLARYQQLIAVNEAIRRISTAKAPAERGGIIWHTQGSGKSLSMLFLAVKLRRMKELENPILVIVTDRKDLDRQITKTFRNCGFPNPQPAKRVTHLRELLQAGTGQTIMTTVQKFMELGEKHPVLTDAENVFVMVDEAHRSQYRGLAANMRKAMKNACFLGFTGTPIDKKDRSTFQTFGPYIHTYTIEQAVQDGATVPIFYESRLPDLQVEGESLDALFERFFRENSPEEREAIKSKYATEAAIAGAPKRVERICLDIIDHFERFIYPNCFKAQIVAVNRETAVLYKETLERLNAPSAALVMSISHNDPKRFRDAAVPKDGQKDVIADFKDKGNELAMLVVCDMLLTGFDAPVEQVMYLDSPLKEHSLLQAIARVNRTYEGKEYGLVVDYWGVSRELQEALAIFSPQDVVGALRPKTDELPRLEARHRAVMRFFDRVDRGNLEDVLKVLEPADVRAEFDLAFKRFTMSLDMVLPDPAGLPYLDDLKWLGKVRTAAKNRYRDQALDLSGCSEKVKKLIEEHIRAEGITQLLEPVSIFSEKFNEHVDKLSSPEAKASEMEHAIRHEITIHLDENPVLYSSLRERLKAIIEARKQERIDAVEQLKRLNFLVEEMRRVGDKAREMGMSEHQFAFYKLLTEPEGKERGLGKAERAGEEVGLYLTEKPDESKRELSGLIFESLAKLAVIDWQHKEDVQREMRRQIKRHLRAAGHKDDIEVLTVRFMDLARARLIR